MTSHPLLAILLPIELGLIPSTLQSLKQCAKEREQLPCILILHLAWMWLLEDHCQPTAKAAPSEMLRLFLILLSQGLPNETIRLAAVLLGS